MGNGRMGERKNRGTEEWGNGRIGERKNGGTEEWGTEEWENGGME